jgi:hypothetical protein
MKNLWFTLLLIVSISVVSCGGLSSKQQTAVNESLQSLKKIQAATSIGIDYRAHGQLLIDAKAKTDEVRRIVPAGALKDELIAAIDSYELAHENWKKADEQESMMDNPRRSWTSREQINKFFDEKGKAMSDAIRNRTENWEAASQHVEKASKLAE